jgi:ABC-2 type transport system permease protein
MAISRASVLSGRVVGSMIRTLIGVVLVIGVALIAGFRPNAGPIQWLAAFGFIALLTLALTWLAVALGMAAKSPAGANGSTLLLQFVGPFISSAFVRPATMPAGVRWFAENQPFTPMIETLRGLLLGTPIGNHAIIAIAWCVAIALGGYLWARVAYSRDPIRPQ